MVKVLDLFAGTQSVKKALELMDIEFDYKGVDIYSPEGENIILSLAENNSLELLIEKLDGWVPDVIWASPVCNTFSTACAYKGGNLYYEKIGNDDLKVRTKMDDPTNKRYRNVSKLPVYQEKARQGLLMHKNCKNIIEHFKVPFAIENPSRAMSRFLYKDYIANKCEYCAYGFTYKKPTSIYSNMEIPLNRCNHKGKHENAMSGISSRNTITEYSVRSSVPPKLIRDVFSKLLNKEVI